MVDFQDVLYQKEVKNLDVLPFTLGNMLIDLGYNIAVAESISGGHISSQIVKVPGCSRYFVGGVVAYSNLLKVNLCNVNPKSIQRYGAVSSIVTSEMAIGIKDKLKTDIAIATTGFAGPQQEQEKVGLTYITIIIHDHEIVKNFIFNGERMEIITQTTFTALELLRYYLAH